MSNLTVVSLFSGIGGIDLGFINAGFDVVWANELNSYSCATYRENFAGNVLHEGDIREIKTYQVPKATVLVAGFPCQSFSIMGYQRGFKDPRGNLFFEIARIANEIKPEIIFLENVKNLIYHDNGKTFNTIYSSLAGLGYGVKYSVQNACTHANIPQDRNRTFVAAFLDYSVMSRFTFNGEIKLTKGINDIINRSIRHSDDYYYNESNKYYPLLNSRIKDKTGIYRIDDSGVANKRYEISPTLKANMGTYPDRVPVIRDDFGIRKLTPYECLALQGFPDTFKFAKIPLNEAYKQAGNTVCVPVVEKIARNIRTALEGVNKDEQNV